jgi:hypothetical protein
MTGTTTGTREGVNTVNGVRGRDSVYDLLLGPSGKGRVLLEVEAFHHRPHELLRAMKELGHPAPVLAVEPWAEQLAMDLVKGGLAADYLLRPVDAAGLAAAMAQAGGGEKLPVEASPAGTIETAPVAVAGPELTGKRVAAEADKSPSLAGALMGLLALHGERAWENLPGVLAKHLPAGGGLWAVATRDEKELHLAATVGAGRVVVLYTAEAASLEVAARWLEANRGLLADFATACDRLGKMATLVTKDGETGLANARYFSHLLGQAIVRARELRTTLHLAKVLVEAGRAVEVAGRLAPAKARCITGRLDEGTLVVAVWGGERGAFEKHVRGLSREAVAVVTYPFDGATAGELLAR